MNDAWPLARDVALLAGALGDPVQVNVMAGMAVQNVQGLTLPLGIAGSYPKQETAMVQMLIKMLGVLMSDKARQRRRDQPAGSAGDCRCGKDAQQRSAGSSHCKATDHRRHIHAGTNNRALGIADRLVRDIADARSLRIVLEFGG